MCGIVVGLAFGKLNKRDEDIRQRLLRYFTTEMLIATEERGKDATGAVVLFDDGKFMGLKRGEASSDFLASLGETKEYYGSLMKVWREHDALGRVFLGHCRAATLGDKEDNENNHPIKIGNLVGIHNGKIDNHRKIIEKLGCKRDGQVDSEAIFRLLDYYTDHGKEPFTMEMIQEIVRRLDGTFAVTLFNADNLEQIPVFRDRRPVEMVLIRPLGILFLLSEDKYWNRVHYRYERLLFYYNEVLGLKLPSFLDDKDIQIKSLPDDHAMIFDLSKKVNMDTDIYDLGDKSRMDRAKLDEWKQSYTTSYTTNYGVHNKATSPTIQKKEDGDGKKRRIFDKLKKRYVTSQGDKVLSDGESAVMDVDTGNTKKESEEQTSTATGSHSGAPPIVVNDKRKLNNPKVEDKEEKSDSVEVKDHTDYISNSPKESKDEDVIDIPAKDVKVVEESKPEIVEIMMNIFPVEAVQAAKDAYENMPKDKKGYGNINDLLSDIEIQNEQVAVNLGIQVVSNRVAQKKWKEGFMAGYTMAAKGKMSVVDDESDDDKTAKREKHIVGLKSLVILLSKFYNKAQSECKEDVKQKLATVAMDNMVADIENISKIFNDYERKSFESVKSILDNAKDYKEEDKEKRKAGFVVEEE
jgi:glucosamine 6-phosphate synthetase-like amidotransferase/phosphosugar isomerase protein